MSTRILFIFLLALASFACNQSNPKYVYNKGVVYGTTYSIIYESPQGKDFQRTIEDQFRIYTMIFSPYEQASTISKINRNETVQPEKEFIQCFERSMQISEITHGAFDITAGSLVNAWGFGPERRQEMTSEMVDSLLEITGYKKVKLKNGQIEKSLPGIHIDMNAISKGFTCDLLASFLEEKGCQNYMIEIGGEVVAKGKNAKGKTWVVGIRKPDENPFMAEIEAKIQLDNHGMATSGNYLNFYEIDGKKYAHSIDPGTGYPVIHSLLSATVIAEDCMTADAFATAFMVMGKDLTIEIARQVPGLEIFLIYSNGDGKNEVYMSDGFEGLLLKD